MTRSVAALCAIALVPRIIAAALLGDGLHFADEARYADTARRLLSGDGFGASYGGVPGYPTLLALLWALVPASPVWLRAAQAAVTALGAGLVFALADRLLGRNTALAATLIYALDPLLVVAGGLLYPEAVAAIVLMLVVLFAWEAARSGLLSVSWLSGACLGILALFRPVALVLVPVVAAWIVLNGPGRPRRRALYAGGVLFGCALLLAPWTYRNYRIHGRLIPVSLVGTRTAPVPRSEVDRHGLAAAIARKAWEDPLALAPRMAGEFLHFWELAPSRLMTDDPVRRRELHQRDSRLPVNPTFSRSLRDLVSAIAFGLELTLALGGVVLLWRSRRRQTVLLLSIVLAYAVGYSLFVGKLRYRIPILPLVFLFAGAAAAALYAAIRQPRHRLDR